jgi:putative ABC transport system permease protein
MKLSRNLLLSFEILAAHKLRTLLSLSGIVVGVGAVVVMVSVVRGAERRILNMISDMGPNLLIVNSGQTRLVAGRQRQITTVTSLIPADAAAIVRECPSVAQSSPAISRKLSTRWMAENTNTTVLGMSPEGFAIRNISLTAGRFFDEEEARARRRVAVIGPTVVENLFLGVNPLGQQFRIGTVPFEVIGVSSAKGVDIGGADLDDAVIVPLETAMLRLYNVPYLSSVFVQAKTAADLDRAEREITDLLRQRHRLRDKPDDFTIQNQATLLETERETTRSMALLTGSVAGISLLVGGVGILAVMLISVRERTREIGLRRAVGALKSDIRTQFLLESGLLACAGGIIGAAAGIAIALGVAFLGYWEVVVSWPAVATGFGFSVSVGLLFGIYPATRAAGLEPIQALRAE